MVKKISLYKINVEVTRRQMQFLEVVVNYYLEKNEIVSYKGVADILDVSRWTAYDILQGLYKKGLLEVKYKPIGGPGRSEVYYVPTKETIERVKSGIIFATINSIGKWFTDHVRKIETFSVKSSIDFVFDRVKGETNPLIVVLYTLVLFVILLKVFKIELENLINLKVILHSNIYAPAVLPFFVEVVFVLLRGKALNIDAKLGEKAFKKLSSIVKKFRENLTLISPSFQENILKHLNTIIQGG